MIWPNRPCPEPELVIGDAVGHEAAWCLDMIQRSMGEDLADHERQETAADLETRLAGPCDLCRDEDHHGLTVDGGLAVCGACLDTVPARVYTRIP